MLVTPIKGFELKRLLSISVYTLSETESLRYQALSWNLYRSLPVDRIILLLSHLSIKYLKIIILSIRNLFWLMGSCWES
jgi:hypothetical protein